jgi:hypothetical protein
MVLTLFMTGFAVSTLLSWRLVTVVTKSADSNQREDAIRMFGYIWGGGTLTTGLVAVVVKLHEIGALP